MQYSALKRSEYDVCGMVFCPKKNIDGDTLFFEYMFKKFTSYIIKKKIVVPMNAEGVHSGSSWPPD